MAKPVTTGRRLYASLPAAGAGLIFTGVGLVFNSTYGYSMGGDNVARKIGMAAVMIGCIFLKDYLPGQAFVAFKSRRMGLGVLCSLGAILGAIFSFIAAFGSASDGQAEKANPLQAQIDAYTTAKKNEADWSKRLDELGLVGEVPDVEAMLARVDRVVRTRTSGCMNLSPEGSGPKSQAWNAEQCQDVREARTTAEKAKEVKSLSEKIEKARDVLAKGAPQTADALNTNLSDLWQKLTGQGNVKVSSIISLLCALVVEISGPIAWAAFQLANTVPSKVPMKSNSSTTEFHNTNPKPTNRAGRKRDPRVIDFVTKFRNVHGRNPRIPEMRTAFPEVPKTTLWRNAKIG